MSMTVEIWQRLISNELGKTSLLLYVLLPPEFIYLIQKQVTRLETKIMCIQYWHRYNND